ncbi:tyrosine-type recombinase/integrase [Micromonospora chalcea]
MSTQGSIYKRCACKDDTGRRLGATCPKLRRSGGAWHPSHGTWGYQLELPCAARQGRRQLRRSGFTTRDDAVAELDQARALLALAGDDASRRVEISDLLRQCRPGNPLPDRDTIAKRVRAGIPTAVPTSTGEYLTEWLAGRRGLSEKTLRGYADHIRLYLIPHLGAIPIQNLNARHIDAMYAALEERNAEIEQARASTDPMVRARARGVRPMGAASQQRLRATLRKALNDAIHKARLRDTNPAVSVELPSGKRPKARVWTSGAVKRWRATGERPSPVMVWTPEQAGAFLDYAEAHDIALYPMFLLVLHRGLRRGEACGLRDTDVDLDNGHLTVAQQITTVGYKPVTKNVKSDAGDRMVPLGPKTIAALREYETRRAGWQQVSGTQWPHSGLYFVRPDGKAWHPQTISDRFDHLVANSGLPPVRLHDLRHCAATYLRHGGADLKEIQETLGHSNIAITSDTYTSVILEFQRAHADAAADLIPRGKPAA